MKATKRIGDKLTIIERSNYFARLAKLGNTPALRSLFGYTIQIGENSTSRLISNGFSLNDKINIRGLI